MGRALPAEFKSLRAGFCFWWAANFLKSDSEVLLDKNVLFRFLDNHSSNPRDYHQKNFHYKYQERKLFDLLAGKKQQS